MTGAFMTGASKTSASGGVRVRPVFKHLIPADKFRNDEEFLQRSKQNDVKYNWVDVIISIRNDAERGLASGMMLKGGTSITTHGSA